MKQFLGGGLKATIFGASASIDASPSAGFRNGKPCLHGGALKTVLLRKNVAIVSGSITITIMKNGQSTGQTVVADAANDFSSMVWSVDVSVSAGDKLGIHVDTSADYAFDTQYYSNCDIYAGLELEPSVTPGTGHEYESHFDGFQESGLQGGDGAGYLKCDFAEFSSFVSPASGLGLKTLAVKLSSALESGSLLLKLMTLTGQQEKTIVPADGDVILWDVSAYELSNLIAVYREPSSDMSPEIDVSAHLVLDHGGSYAWLDVPMVFRGTQVMFKNSTYQLYSSGNGIMVASAKAASMWVQSANGADIDGGDATINIEKNGQSVKSVVVDSSCDLANGFAVDLAGDNISAAAGDVFTAEVTTDKKFRATNLLLDVGLELEYQ